jgi:DNA-binding HxlR family transcriptional regulator
MSEAGQLNLSDFCPRYERAMSLLSKRWTGVILRALLAGTCRFNGICAYVPGLSDRLLSERLKELESEGIVERRVYAETPVRIEYVLTPKGEELRDVVQVVQVWADRWLPYEISADPHPASF